MCFFLLDEKNKVDKRKCYGVTLHGYEIDSDILTKKSRSKKMKGDRNCGTSGIFFSVEYYSLLPFINR